MKKPERCACCDGIGGIGDELCPECEGAGLMEMSALISDLELVTSLSRLAIWEAHRIPHGNVATTNPDPDPIPHPDYIYTFQKCPELRGTLITWSKRKDDQ